MTGDQGGGWRGGSQEWYFYQDVSGEGAGGAGNREVYQRSSPFQEIGEVEE